MIENIICKIHRTNSKILIEVQTPFHLLVLSDCRLLQFPMPNPYLLHFLALQHYMQSHRQQLPLQRLTQLISKHSPERRCLPYDFKKKLSTIYISADKNTIPRTKQIPNVAISIASHTASFTATFLTDFIALRLSIAIPPLIAPPMAPPIMGTIEQR